MHSYYPPGWEVQPHTHACDYMEIILEGSQKVTGKWHHAGDVRIARAGTVYGPLIAGPEGVRAFLVLRGYSAATASATTVPSKKLGFGPR